MTALCDQFLPAIFGLFNRKPDGRSSCQFREYHLPDVDVARQKSGLAIGEVVFPQPPKPLIKTHRDQSRPGCSKTVAPHRKGAGIVLWEDSFGGQWHAKSIAECLENRGRWQHPSGKDVASNEIDFA